MTFNNSYTHKVSPHVSMAVVAVTL